MTNEAFARVKIDALLSAQGWDTLDTNAVRFEVQLPDGTRADYVLCDRHGCSLAVIEAKRYSVNPGDAAAQAKAYAQQLGVAYAFLSNGDEVLFWDWQREAYPRPVKTFFKQDDLERPVATLAVRRDPVGVPIDRRIVERDYQIECIDTLCREIGLGRRKLLVEMAAGTGKTRTAAAFIKCLFKANAITRVLFLVDRIPLAKQTEDAFAEHLPDYPADVRVDSAGTHDLHPGEGADRRSQRHAKQRGYDFSDLRARQLVARDFARSDLLLAMDWDNLRAADERCPPEHRHKLRRLTEFCVRHSSEIVPDPYYGGVAGFEHVLDLVEDACDGLLDHVRREVAQRGAIGSPQVPAAASRSVET